ncbi:MAG: aminoglycoside phosphotransferase family protein, partial [Rhizobiales bacterium]|nr:aminoglycoside phosphotransferase family protein [Hyphomicrobiales bacterium]
MSVDFVTNKVLATFDQRRGLEGHWQVAGPVHTTRNCWIYKAHCENHPGAVAVKVYRKLNRSRPVSWYASALRRYAAGMPAAKGLEVPKVLDVQSGRFTLLMEWMDAKPLRRVLLTQDLSPGQRARRIERCGAWLRQFHNLSDVRLEPFEYAKMAMHRQQHVERLESGGVQLSSGSWPARAARLLDAHATKFDGQEVAYCNVHGDVTTSNLMIRGQTVIGLDFDARRRLPLATDVCRLLVHLDVCRYLPTPHWEMDETAGSRRDVEALRSGYGADMFPDGPFFSFVLLNDIVRR